MKTRRRIIAVVLLAVILLTLCCACGKSFTCDWCGQEKTGKQHKLEYYGEKMVICNDCYKEIKDFVKAFGG